MFNVCLAVSTEGPHLQNQFGCVSKPKIGRPPKDPLEGKWTSPPTDFGSPFKIHPKWCFHPLLHHVTVACHRARPSVRPHREIPAAPGGPSEDPAV